MEIRSYKDLETIADEHGWIVNPNKKIAEAILRRLNINKQKFGYFACPCKPQEIGVKKEITPSNIVYISECPCINAKNEILKNGHCHCNLFYKEE